MLGIRVDSPAWPSAIHRGKKCQQMCKTSPFLAVSFKHLSGAQAQPLNEFIKLIAPSN